MANQFLQPSPLGRLTALAAKSRAFVAVPFFGVNGAKLLPLKQGSVLVTRIDAASVKSGHVDPREIVKLLKKGVQVFLCANLHAKVYVFGKTAVIGSANISSTSAGLVEAAIETTEPSIVREAKDFIENLCADPIGIEYAKSLIPLYPKDQVRGSRGSSARLAEFSKVWLSAIEDVEWGEDVVASDKLARPKATKRISDEALHKLDAIHWDSASWKKLNEGERVIQRMTSGRGYVYDPPARIVFIHEIPTGALVYLERQKRLKQVTSAQVRKVLGSISKDFTGAQTNLIAIRSSGAVAKFAKLWPSFKV